MCYEFVWILFLRFLTLRKKLQSAHKAYILNNKLSKLKRHTSHFCCFILVSICLVRASRGKEGIIQNTYSRVQGEGVSCIMFTHALALSLFMILTA